MLERAGCQLRWLASEFDLADDKTKKKKEAPQGVLKRMRAGHWSIRFSGLYYCQPSGLDFSLPGILVESTAHTYVLAVAIQHSSVAEQKDREAVKGGT